MEKYMLQHLERAESEVLLGIFGYSEMSRL